MNPAHTESFRINLLQQLRAAAPSSLAVGTLVTGAILAGFSAANTDFVRSALSYLADKGLVADVPKPISPENKRWRITAAGTDTLAEAGL